MNVAVVGLGQVGLPLAAQFASKGVRVLGCDVDPAVVSRVNRGEVNGDEPGLAGRVRAALDDGLLSAQTSTAAAVRESAVVVVIVPLVVDEEKRIRYRAIDAATADIAAGLRPGTLVVYETTLPVGDTRNRFGRMLQDGSGLRVGEDFSLAFSPERVYVGRVFEDLGRYPKIVGGVDDASTSRAVSFYRSVLDAEVVAVANAETAEFAKLAETTYRDVNIALANEFAVYADEVGVDVLDAIRAANSQPFSHIHEPGLGPGGHCIPVYPYFLIDRARHAELAAKAREVNDRMAGYAVSLLAGELGELVDRRVAIFGYAYRGNVREASFSAAARLGARLRAEGAHVLVHDPYVAPEVYAGLGEPFSLDAPQPVDAVVLQAAHDCYQRFDLGRIPGLRVVLDGRNALDPGVLPGGVRYVGIGRGHLGRRADAAVGPGDREGGP